MSSRAKAHKIAAELSESLNGDRRHYVRQIREALRARAAAKVAWDKADRIEAALLKELGPQMSIALSKKKAARFKDNFADKNKAFRSHGISHYELEIVDVEAA